MTSDGVTGARGWQNRSVWAKTELFEGNQVKQLAAPAGTFLDVSSTDEGLEVRNNFGTWPASPADRGLGEGCLWVKLPPGTTGGHQLSHASWAGTWSVIRSLPEEVLATYVKALSFSAEGGAEPSLRTPQLGAVHAVLGYWTTGRPTPATVVMPTGTGKTETMIALLVAARIERLLVLVPSDNLRTQIADKFERLGVLQELGVVAPSAARPVVGRIEHRFTTAETAEEFARACNVIVATPAVLDLCDAPIKDALLSQCSHLFIDEAHHVAARTWSDIRTAFEGRPVVQFTATPFREDGRHLQGTSIYSFPLREAQRQGYFSQIDYTSVIDFEDVDLQLATLSVARLRSDVENGFDHVLMARVNGIPRAKSILEYYRKVAGDLNPVIINSRMPKKQQSAALNDLRSRKSRIIVCVDMLGEGFDLPALKIAAVHDPHKSLAVTLQFIGRFARTSSAGTFGVASVFVARKEIEIDRRLRQLYAEDSDWNLVLRNLTESSVDEQQAVSEFESGFTSRPDEIALRSLLPKLSSVVYRTPTADWDPQAMVDFFGEGSLLTVPIGLNMAAGVAWCVLERRAEVRWGDVKTVEEVTYELYVLYFDPERKLLYINNSANDGVFQDLAEAVAGQGVTRFNGSKVYRVMADIERLVPTNVGVLDAHDRFRRFSMHAGSDVTASFSQAEAGTKSQTNISGGGYREGERVSISASLKGRIWSHATATSLKHWCDWCDTIGSKLLDDTISIESVIGQFILPQPLEGHPAGILLAAEWPWEVHMQQPESTKFEYEGKTFELAFTDLVPDTSQTSEFFRFFVRTGAWGVPYEAKVINGEFVYNCASPVEVVVQRGKASECLSDWMNRNGLILILDDDRVIEGDLIYKPTWDKEPYTRDQLTAIDWTDVDLSKESQTKDRMPDSIQFRALERLQEEDWEIILDDDGAGEIADVVALRTDAEGLLVKLIHCKYSHGGTVGARVIDLYEVCGQAQKSIVWRRNDLNTMFRVLEHRARKKKNREGVSPFIAGDVKKLYELRERAMVLRRRVDIVVVQPGLSVAAASQQQLDLLASTQAYLQTTIGAQFEVWCSA